MSRRAVIVVAGGSGQRMATATPKQFLLLREKPVLIHSLEAFAGFDPAMQLILVLPKMYLNHFVGLKAQYAPQLNITLTEGGAERYHSVQNGLAALHDDVSLVAIHDAVRPLVSKGTIQRTFELAMQTGAAIPAIPVADSLRRGTTDKNEPLSRDGVFSVQTPQVFTRRVLSNCYDQPFSKDFTDDASVVEAAGYTISLCEGNVENVKITTPQDLSLAEKLLNNTI